MRNNGVYTEESIRKGMLEGRCGSTYEGHSPASLEALSSIGNEWQGFGFDNDRKIYVGFLCRKCLTLVFVDDEKLVYTTPPTPPMP